MAWTLRPATLADLPALVGHRDAMWLEMGRVQPGEDDPTSAAYGKWLADRMQAGALHGVVAEERGRVLASGCVWIQDVQPRPGHPLTMWGYILSVYTVPSARRRGLARAIVTACMDRARQAGCTRATLHASDLGRRLYGQLGFEPTDEMWADLRAPEHRPKAHPPRPAAHPTGRGARGPRGPREPRGLLAADAQEGPRSPRSGKATDQAIEIGDLESAALQKVLYWPASRQLVAVFPDGSAYAYEDTTEAEFLALVAARSRGTHFNRVFKREHPKLRPLPEGHPLLAEEVRARVTARQVRRSR